MDLLSIPPSGGTFGKARKINENAEFSIGEEHFEMLMK
jgi:hypothetical protein